jgi:hypothetical protein
MTHSACGPVAGDPYDRPGSPDRPRSPSPDHPRNRSRRKSNSPRRSRHTSKEERKEQLLISMVCGTPTHGPKQTRNRLEKVMKRFFEIDNTSQPQKPSDTQAGPSAINRVPSPCRNQAQRRGTNN